MKGISILLTTVILLAAMVGCSGNGLVEYDLTIASTSGGSVAEPGEGIFAYDEGTVVQLVAAADEGYWFVEWTGNVGTIADPNDATTTITMNSSYSITANFASATEIYDWYDLDAVRDNLGGNYTLMSDLDCTTPGYEELASSTANGAKGWQPIGGMYPDEAFVGSFDGQNCEIRDLVISRPGEMCVGLFGAVGETGVVENLGVVNSSANGGIDVGGLVGANLGTVSNSYATGNMTASFDSVGGLIGFTAGIVNNSYSTGTVTGDRCVGGLVGYNGGTDFAATVNSSYSTGTVTGSEWVGGLVGFNMEGCTVSHSYSIGSVTGNSSVGGLVGYNHDGSVTHSFWDTETSGQATSDGGTGKTTAEMHDIVTFSGAGWPIIAVANSSTRDPAYIWNIVNNVTYPFLSWEAV